MLSELSRDEIAETLETLGVTIEYNVRIRPAEMFVDETKYQRLPRLRKTWIQKTIVDKFDPSRLRELIVSKRPDGRYSIIDGGGRHYAVTVLMDPNKIPEDFTFRCEVYHNLSERDEARLFSSENNDRRPLSAKQKFKAAVVGEQPDAMAINSIFVRRGLVVGNPWSQKGISSIPFILGLYKLDVLPETLDMLRAIWLSFKVNQTLLVAVGIVLHAYRYDMRFDRDRFMHILHTVGPDEFEIKVKRLLGSRLHADKYHGALAEEMVKSFNYRLNSKNQLDIKLLENSHKSFLQHSRSVLEGVVGTEYRARN